MSSDFFRGLFGNSGAGVGTANLPFYRNTTAPGMPLQDVLMNKFGNREGVFAPVPMFAAPKPAVGASPFAAKIFGQELGGGGLRWSYDPNWLKSIRPPVPEAEPSSPMAEILNEHPGKYNPGGEPELTDPGNGRDKPWLGTPFVIPPMPPPKDPYGHWTITGTNNGGDGFWHWIPGGGPPPGREEGRRETPSDPRNG